MAEGKEIEVYKPTDLQSRLKEEQEMLEKYFWPEKFLFIYQKNEHYFERTVKLRSDRIYKLRVYVNSHYPDSLPDLVVCDSPESMPIWGVSHDTHTWQPKDGCLHICHWRGVCWSRKYMIYHVFNKGEEWLEAYEKYLENRILPLDLEQMQPTEEEEMKEQIHQQQQTAFALFQNPNFLRSELFRWHFNVMCREILSQRFPITDKDKGFIQQRKLGSAVKRINQDPIIGGRLAEMFGTQCSISLLQPLAITNEIRMAQQKILESTIQRTNHEPTIICIAAPCRLKYEITQRKLANPGCTVNDSFTDSFGWIHAMVKPIPPQNSQNCDK